MRNSTEGDPEMLATLRWTKALLIALAATGLTAQKTPDEALRALTEGNRRFAAGRSVPQPLGEGVRRSLASGQSPFAVVLCCADSRVPPEHVFNCGLGELFVVRVAGNVCDRETLASIEYAVEHLNTPLVVVLGHESCGAVAATVDQVQASDHEHVEPADSPALQQLFEQIEPAVRKARARDLGGKELNDACEEENAHLTLHECMRRSPLLRRYVQVGRVQMVAARYHLQSGDVEWLPNRPLPPEPRFQQDAAGNAPIGVPPHVALRMLQAGHRRFLGNGLPGGDLTAARREGLAHGQQPLAIVLTCADSRVAPEHVFDAGLGELFVVRIAGNLVTDDVLASVEYAAVHTGASLLVVMGHTRCGAITAAAKTEHDENLTPNMRALLAGLEPAVERVRRPGQSEADLVDLAVRANVLRTATEITSRSTLLKTLEERGRFAVLPTVYDIASGDLTWLKETDDTADMAAPGGETKQRHKEHGEPAHEDPHGSDEGGHDTHGAQADGHGSGHGDSVPPKSTPAFKQSKAATGHAATEHDATHGHGGGEAHGAEAAHGDPAGHGSHAGPGSQDSHAAHGEDEAAAETEHGEAAGRDGHDGPADGHAEKAPAQNAKKNPWLDPITLVGMSGIASLLLAALIAVLKRD
ncbi:MAG: hypothetical protein IT181_17960 [Acidobacteria bacterium]|nr:hypothetical protein [Acidobacteriota bacterium]